MQRKNPQTSHEAYKSVTPEMLHGHYKKIKDALERLGTANYEAIGLYVGLEPHAVGRRLKEMEGLELVVKTGEKSFTKSGRQAFNYCLSKTGATVTKAVTEKFPEGKASHEYSSSILQQSLF